MHLVFDIFQGIGIAAAVGIRPFLPALLVGVLAAGNVEIHFTHTHFSFLQSVPFLLALVVLAIALALLERRSAGAASGRGAPTRPPGRASSSSLSGPAAPCSARCSSPARWPAAITPPGPGSSAG